LGYQRLFFIGDTWALRATPRSGV